MNIFERYTHVLDAELQQRACEYLAMAQRPDTDDLLSTTCDEMPVFPERESALVHRLHRKGEDVQDKRTWVIGHSAENKGRESERFKAFRQGQANARQAMEQQAAPTAAPAESSRNGAMNGQARPAQARAPSLGPEDMMGSGGVANGDESDIMTSLADLDLSGGNASGVQDEPLVPNRQPSASIVPTLSNGAAAESSPAAQTNGAANGGLKYEATLGGVAPALLAPLTVAPNIEKVSSIRILETSLCEPQWLERLTYAPEGVLYEDDHIQIGCKTEFHGAFGRIALFFGNKVATPITDITMTVEYPEGTLPSAIHAAFHDPPVNEIAGRAQVQELIHAECKDFFAEPPVLRMTYLAGSFTTLVLKLPMFLTRFIEGVSLEQSAFFERWKIIGGELAV